jgi:Arc/MetJ-type ribon-helix-helix transcriptional regulator
MTDADSAKRVECDRYRTMANEIRALLPRLSQSEAIEELRLLAIRYERLAEHLEAAP